MMLRIEFIDTETIKQLQCIKSCAVKDIDIYFMVS